MHSCPDVIGVSNDEEASELNMLPTLLTPPSMSARDVTVSLWNARGAALRKAAAAIAGALILSASTIVGAAGARRRPLTEGINAEGSITWRLTQAPVPPAY